jgi:NAD-dependent deacetylase
LTEVQTSDAQKAADQIHDWIEASQCAIAFTGAGISTESGIPDFRSPGGVWSRYRTVYFDEFCESAEARHEYWRQKVEAHHEFADAEPNVTHRTLAAWETSEKLYGVVTQNIDGLHQRAGSKRVQQLHGTAREVSCLDCGWRDGVNRWVKQFAKTHQVPECPECGGRLKHATVSFGQSLPPDILNTATAWAKRSDLFLALGSSLVVEPAASLPRMAVSNGAKLIIINRDETPLDGVATLTVRAALGDVFKALNDG